MFLDRLIRQAMVMMLAMACIAAAASPAGGEEQECPPCDKDELLSVAPIDVDAIVVVNGAAVQRGSAAGRAFELMLKDADYLPETRSAWRELAHVLNWSGERAFDELMGERIALVMRGIGSPEDMQWAVLSEVSASTERLLRSRLRPAPRGSILGFPSLSVENGRFELVVGPSGLAADSRALILLGPSGGTLLAELAPMLRRPMPNPPRDPSGRECDFIVMLRQPKEADADGEAGRGVVLLTGTMERGGWDVRLAASPGMVWGRPAGMDRIQPWSESAFKVVEKDSLLAMMGVIGSTRLEGISSVPALSGLLPVIPFSLEGEEFGQRAALFVREAAQAPFVPAGSPAGWRERDALEGGEHRMAMVAPPAGIAYAGRAERGLLTVGMAIEAADSRQMQIEGDRMIARLVGGIESGELLEQRAEPRQQMQKRVQLVVTVPDSEFRVLRLNGESSVNAALARGLELAFGGRPVLSWGVRTLRDGPGINPGWWAATIAPSESPSVERVARELAESRGGTVRPRLSMGMVRPAALEQAVARLNPHFFAPLRGMRWIDSLRWDAWQRDDGAVEATIRIRMLISVQ